jgi:iron(III) transport system ATP-binding protein
MTHTNKGSVRFDGVVKTYGEVIALKRLDLTIERGNLVTLLGPSGCGKTTTLRLIAGLELATEGKIHIGDQDVTHLTATYRKVSMVFQSYALFPHMTVRENVAYGLTVKSVPKREAQQNAEQGLELVGLAGFGDRLPSELSGGQQQRVAVARAIVLEPEVLLFEEIRQIQQRLGLTAVYVTHDQEEAMAVSDRIIVMNNAQIAQEGSPRDLYDVPSSAFVADFIGDANLADCMVEAFDAGIATVSLGRARYSVKAKETPKGAARLVLRPHDLDLLEPGQSGIAGTITYAAYLGKEMQYTVETAIGSLFVICPVKAVPFVYGDDVTVGINPAKARLVAG